MLSFKLFQILELEKHNRYHLMNVPNIEKNLQNPNVNQNLGFNCDIQKFLHPSFAIRKKVV